MTTIVLSERECAEYALQNHVLGRRPGETLGRVARYYYGEGYKKAEIADLLEDFLLKCDPSVNIVKWQASIDRAAKSADKYALIDIRGVGITQKELDAIRLLEGRMMQKLMFTMLCLAKYGNAVRDTNNNWVNRTDREIFSLANISVTTKRQALMMNDLWKSGYIRYSKVVDNTNINVLIVDGEGEPVTEVADFRNIGSRYMMMCGEPYMECECCGKVIRKMCNTQKYCPECAVEMNRNNALRRYREQAAG